MTKNTVWLISGGTNYYMSGAAGGSYTGSGTPWTSESTSPYRLALNDVAGPSYVPTPAPGTAQYSAGRLIGETHENITEDVGVQLYASSKDNAIFLLRQLRRILNTALYSEACILAITGGTNTAYYLIERADVPESSLYIQEGGSSKILFRATITWTRSPFGGQLDNTETLISGANNFTNSGTGSPDNVVAYSAGTGDLINSTGQPLNIVITPASGDVIGKLFAATIYERTYSTSGAGGTSTTSTTTGTAAGSLTIAADNLVGRFGLTAHLLTKATLTSEAEVKVFVRLGTASGALLYTSPWLGTAFAAGSGLFHFGDIPLDWLQRFFDQTDIDLFIQYQVRSTDGTSETFTLTSTELLLCYTFCVIDNLDVTGTSTEDCLISTFPAVTTRPHLPYEPVVLTRDSANVALRARVPEGEVPRYFEGASLFLEWVNKSEVHVPSDTASVVVTHAPQFVTLRGNV